MLTQIEFHKWPATAHYTFPAWRLGEDAHGVWLCGEAGTLWTRGPEDSGRFESDFVVLIPNGGWWLALWHAPPDPIELYVDISTPAHWMERGVVLVDLDLDIVRTRDGAVRLVDEDEFEVHQVALRYPADLIEGARTAARSLLDAVASRTEPFGVTSQRWLSQLCGPGPHTLTRSKRI